MGVGKISVSRGGGGWPMLDNDIFQGGSDPQGHYGQISNSKFCNFIEVNSYLGSFSLELLLLNFINYQYSSTTLHQTRVKTVELNCR